MIDLEDVKRYTFSKQLITEAISQIDRELREQLTALDERTAKAADVAAQNRQLREQVDKLSADVSDLRARLNAYQDAVKGVSVKHIARDRNGEISSVYEVAPS